MGPTLTLKIRNSAHLFRWLRKAASPKSSIFWFTVEPKMAQAYRALTRNPASKVARQGIKRKLPEEGTMPQDRYLLFSQRDDRSRSSYLQN